METLALGLGDLGGAGRHLVGTGKRSVAVHKACWASHSGHIEVSIRSGGDNAKTQKIAKVPFFGGVAFGFNFVFEKANVVALL